MKYSEVINHLQNLIKGEVSQAEFARACNLPRSTVNYRKLNNADFSVEEVKKIKTYFQNKTEEWQDVSETCSTSVTLDYVQASCGNGITLDTSLIPNYSPEFKYSVAIAKGTSMQPTINSDDVCIIKRFNGDFVDGVYLFSIGDEMFIKRLANNVNQLVCLSDNKEFDKIILQGDELDKVNIVGEVIGLIRKV